MMDVTNDTIVLTDPDDPGWCSPQFYRRWQTRGLSALGKNALRLAAQYVDGRIGELADRRDGSGRKVGRDTLGSLSGRGLMTLDCNPYRLRTVRPLPRKRVEAHPEFAETHEAELIGTLTARGWEIVAQIGGPLHTSPLPRDPDALVDECFRAAEDQSGHSEAERAALVSPWPTASPATPLTDQERWEQVQAGFALSGNEFAVAMHDLEDSLMEIPAVQELAAAVQRGEDPWRGPTAPPERRFYWAVEDGDRTTALEIARQEFGKMEFMRTVEENFLSQSSNDGSPQ
jgi:hypothetical protein